MCTRGRLNNHIYLQLVGDGDPHTLIRPETIRLATPTELLEQILARDDTPRSASTLLRKQQTQRCGSGTPSAVCSRTAQRRLPTASMSCSVPVYSLPKDPLSRELSKSM
jgi:hypothetical protein